ncbi:hypothetical protein PV04_10170 [Phialophora macrospora]|uniref:Amine oxidase n=1 Tax=Phialophora macrospora TaxID=1851006 RepID=A0A0D2CDY0_9EURO|nr:hypothetical protein PV04_10170 [Phialophora macrospora]
MAPPPPPSSHSVTSIQPHGLKDVMSVYSHVSVAPASSRAVAVAGQVGEDPNGYIPSDPVEQAKLAFKNAKRCLEAAGATSADITQLHLYVVGFDPERRYYSEPLSTFLADARPAITLVPVPALAKREYLIEVEVSLAIPQHAPRRVDVVIVGAGLSGLQAAVDLQNSGLQTVVVEARDRIGGKVWSHDVGNGSVVDLGGAWINDTSQSRAFALSKRFGLDLVSQMTEGSAIVRDQVGKYDCLQNGQVFSNSASAEAINDSGRIRDLLEETCQKLDIRRPIDSAKNLPDDRDIESLTLEQWVSSKGGGEGAQKSAQLWTRAILGLEPSEVGALYFMEYCKSGGGLLQLRSDLKDGAQYLRFADGAGSLCNGLAAEATTGSIHLNSPVRDIRQTANEVVVQTARGLFHCARVILSIPTPLYKEINFDPPLPADKQRLSQRTRLGTFCKVILVYRRPWWRKSGLSGTMLLQNSPILVSRDTSADSRGQFSLTCFLAGGPAREWMVLPPRDRQELVLREINGAFGHIAKVDPPAALLEQIWPDEQWSQGCPCPAMLPGDLTEFEKTLRAPFRRVHFIGTETAYEWKGYMEGALRSGERGAREVLHLLGSPRL